MLLLPCPQIVTFSTGRRGALKGSLSAASGSCSVRPDSVSSPKRGNQKIVAFVTVEEKTNRLVNKTYALTTWQGQLGDYADARRLLSAGHCALQRTLAPSLTLGLLSSVGNPLPPAIPEMFFCLELSPPYLVVGCITRAGTHHPPRQFLRCSLLTETFALL
jgi:hypothetical protein